MTSDPRRFSTHRPADGQLPAHVVSLPDAGHLPDVRADRLLARPTLDEEPAALRRQETAHRLQLRTSRVLPLPLLQGEAGEIGDVEAHSPASC